MNYGSIKKTDIANGIGVRVTLFVSGCTHHCEGCFNPETWNFQYGEVFDEKAEDEVVKALAPSFIKGLTLLGGEPMEPQNQKALLPFVKKIKNLYPEKDIWCYTGYTLECDLLGKTTDGEGRTGRAKCEETEELLSYIDVLVDGEFVLAKKDIRLKYRGSANQRLIDLKASLRENETVMYDLEGRKI